MGQTHRHLPRLRRESYQGLGAVHWAMCLVGRATGWLDDGFHARFREVTLHTCVRHHCVCAAYCLMPDHLHLLLHGTQDTADLYLAARFLRKHLEPALHCGAFQKQAYDHVLREAELQRNAFAKTCHYIFENPVRAGLCREPHEYRFSGGIVPGYPDLCVHAEAYWDLYWRICGCL